MSVKYFQLKSLKNFKIIRSILDGCMTLKTETMQCFQKEECGCEFPSIKAGTTGELGTLRNLLKLKFKKNNPKVG